MNQSGFPRKDASPLGLFMYAHSYWASASALAAAQVDATHPAAPVDYLYYHAIELFLKSYLLQHGVSRDDLRKKYSHKLEKTAKAAQSLGLQVDQIDFDTLKFADANYMDARYLRTGPFTKAHPGNLWGTCSVFFDQMVDVLVAAGELKKRVPARPDNPH